MTLFRSEMAVDGGSDPSFEGLRDLPFDQSVTDGFVGNISSDIGRDGCKYVSAGKHSKQTKILALVAILALLLSVVAVVMTTIQWKMLQNLRGACRQTGYGPPTEPSTIIESAKNAQAQHTPELDVVGSTSPTDGATIYSDCPVCRTRRDGESSVSTERRDRKHETFTHSSDDSRSCNHSVTAIHFQGFPPGIYHLGQDGTFVWWRPASWYRHRSGFHYNHSTGHVTVRQTGLYFIYSQMAHIEHISQTYAIMINGRPFLKCVKSAPLAEHTDTYEASCYTGGATILHKNDQVWIKGIHTSGEVAVKPESTFWGLIQLEGHHP